MPITEIAQTLGCSRHTIYKALAQVQDSRPALAAD
jgi:DNA-binding GntR family transcriptional regulator